MNFFKKQFLSKIYRKEIAFKSINSKRKFNKKISNIGVILDGNLSVPEDLMFNLASIFGLSKSRVFILIYTDIKRKENLVSSERRFYSSDINFFGKFNKTITKFNSKRYDILINYYDRNFLPMKLVTLRCQSKINVGFSNVDHRLNDLILNIDITDSLLFLSEFEKYIKLLCDGFEK
tara:strand:+ start:73 stop:603 length:531 start_codon:yes stop_codon:yes gene_type:complete